MITAQKVRNRLIEKEKEEQEKKALVASPPIQELRNKRLLYLESYIDGILSCANYFPQSLMAEYNEETDLWFTDLELFAELARKYRAAGWHVSIDNNDCEVYFYLPEKEQKTDDPIFIARINGEEKSFDSEEKAFSYARNGTAYHPLPEDWNGEEFQYGPNKDETVSVFEG
jgi:hypothetical protein